MKLQLRLLPPLFFFLFLVLAAVTVSFNYYVSHISVKDWNYKINNDLHDYLLKYEKKRAAMMEFHDYFSSRLDFDKLLYEKNNKEFSEMINSYTVHHPEVERYEFIHHDGSVLYAYNTLDTQLDKSAYKNQFLKDILFNQQAAKPDLDAFFLYSNNPDRLYLAVSKKIKVLHEDSTKHSQHNTGYFIAYVALDFFNPSIDNQIPADKSGIAIVDAPNYFILNSSENPFNFLSGQTNEKSSFAELDENFIAALTKSHQLRSLELIHNNKQGIYLKALPLSEGIYIIKWVDRDVVEHFNSDAIFSIGFALGFSCLLLMVSLLVSHKFFYFNFPVSRSDKKNTPASDMTVTANPLQTNNNRLNVSHYDRDNNLSGFDTGEFNLTHENVFRVCLEKSLAIAQRSQGKLALLTVDIDNLEPIVDALGLQMIEQLMTEFCDRLQNIVRAADFVSRFSKTDEKINNSIQSLDNDQLNHNPVMVHDGSGSIVSRYGTDTLVLMLPNLLDEYDACVVANRLIDHSKKIFTIGEKEIQVSISVGIAIYPTDATNAMDLIEKSCTAKNHAKQIGKNHYKYYSDTLNSYMLRRNRLEERMQTALDNQKFYVVYQPQIETRSGHIIGVEALARWRDDQEGIIPPDEFIPVAEDSGFINKLGEWILRHACLQAKQWADINNTPVKVSVNVSSIQLQDGSFVSILQDVLNECELLPEFLELEITESCFIDNPDHVIEVLNRIRALGVSIALDDFGTGYSSLAYLRSLPINSLKIDRSFIEEIGVESSVKSILTSIFKMAHSLNLTVVAEGVEYEDQLHFLKECRCDFVQGYYFYKPMLSDELTTLLKENFSQAKRPGSQTI